MKVAVLCEFSGTVRDAFIAKGHEAISCDLLDTEKPGPHIKGNCLDYDWSGYDLIICHPPCTYLAISGASYFKYRQQEQDKALRFVMDLFNLPVRRLALENPISVISSRIAKPTQVIHPWQFGHPEAKATCLWLLNLPKLIHTRIMCEREEKNRNHPPGPNRWKFRSRTFQGIANAMADQWGCLD